MTFPELISVNKWKQISKNSDTTLSKEVENALRNVYKNQQLQDRFDACIEVYELCKTQQKTSPLAELKESITKIMAHILNIDEKQILPPDDLEKIIEERISRRKVVREYDQGYLPWKRPTLPSGKSNDPYEVIMQNQNSTLDQNAPGVKYDEMEIKTEKNTDLVKAMDDFKKQTSKDLLQVNEWQAHEDYKHSIKYFEELEREQFRVIAFDGQLTKLQVSGKADDQSLKFVPYTTEKEIIKAFDALTNSSQDIKGTAIYVIDQDGSIFVGSSIHPDRFNALEKLMEREAVIHPSYSSSPFMAGQIEGRSFCSMLDAGSGHFKPSKERYELTLRFLSEIHIIDNHTRLTYFDEQGNFTSQKRDANEIAILKFIKQNKIVMSQFGNDERAFISFLYEHTPELALQNEINNAFFVWQRESKTFAKGSEAKLKIDETLLYFSRFANADDPEKSLFYLENVLNAIQAWRDFHTQENKTSKRLPAVDALEERLLRFKFTLLLDQYLYTLAFPLASMNKCLSFAANPQTTFKFDTNKKSSMKLFDESESEIPTDVMATIQKSKTGLGNLKSAIDELNNLMTSLKQETFTEVFVRRNA